MGKSIWSKILLIALALVLAGLALFIYNTYFGDKSVAGEKEVLIQIVIEKQNIDKIFHYKTGQGFLYDLLIENQEELGVSFKEYDFGVMLVGLLNYKADESNNEYFHIFVNGEEAMAGLQGIVLADRDYYKIELTTW